MKTSRELLIENGFHKSPNVYFNSFTGESDHSKERFNNGITKPKNPDVFGRYEGVEAVESGFLVFYDHGKLCDNSVINFPKYATEENYEGAFLRLKKFIMMNYEFCGGLPSGIYGD